MNNTIVNKLGFIDEEVEKSLNLAQEIVKLKNQKNAIILAHYYQNSEIQDIADFVGDSLALSQKAATINSSIIVFAGVKFMAETTKILAPKSKVLLPDLNAGCSLADSCRYDDFKKFIEKYPNHKVVTYVNTTADIKSLSYVCCTSSNAIKVVNSIPKGEPIIFAPDRNLGNYIKGILKRENMVVWDGACHVHNQFSLQRILDLKSQNPDAKILAHPECQKQILLIADFIGSTSDLVKYSVESSSKKFIIVTEVGVIHQMEKMNPDKEFIPAPPDDSTCACNECSFMKLITLKKLYLTLKYELPEIQVDKKFIDLARLPIERMLKL